MLKIVEAKSIEDYQLWLKYNDGQEGIVDLSDLAGKGVFALWDDIETFTKFQVESGREVIWSDQVALCADSLYLKLTGEKPEDIFPTLAQSADARN